MALFAAAVAASLHALAHPRGLPRRRCAARMAVQWAGARADRVVVREPVAVWRSDRSAPGGAARLEREAARRVARASDLQRVGLFEFAAGLVPMFWRGELAWHRTDLAWPAMDALYTGSTLLLLGLACVGLRGREPGRFLAEGLAGLALAVAVASLAVLSLAFVFDATTNPPASHPYFVQGRLISGVLLPFLLLYVRGLEVAVGWLPARAARLAGWLGLGALALAVSISELALAAPVFASAYNAFHLP